MTLPHEESGPAPQPGRARSATRETADGPGSRAHVLQTLDRAFAAMRRAHELLERQESLLARAGTILELSDAELARTTAIRAELRPSVVAFARRLRHDGVPPEAMLVQVKAAVRDALPPELDSRDAQLLVDDAVRWSIDAYYQAA